LEKHRTYGTGPTYRKLGGRVVYALEDLKAWVDRGTKNSTSDPGAGTVLPAKTTHASSVCRQGAALTHVGRHILCPPAALGARTT
jgi:hypothetical protein